MSDNRTTELLCKLLDERGVEYFTDDDERAYDEPARTTWDFVLCGYEMTVTATEFVDIEGKTYLEMDFHHAFTPEQAIAATLGTEINGETSDGYHTFNELYHHRAVLFSVVVANYRDAAWKAKKHHDGIMYDGMFIVGIDTPWGQASYHYDIDPYWGMFDCEEREAAPEWDGHTPDEAIERIGKLATLGGNGYKQIGEERDYPKHDGLYECPDCGNVVYFYAEDYQIPFNHCPNCGKAVKR